MKRNLKMLLFICALICLTALATVCACADSPERQTPTVSHGLSVLSARTDLALSAMRGNEIVFSLDAVARGMNLATVRYLTVTELPSVTEGELLLGSSRVAAGQSISGAQLDHLSFVPVGNNVSRSSFQFTVNGNGHELTCSLWLLDEENASPTVTAAPVLSLKRYTYRDMALYGTLSAYDPNGDDLRFEVVSYPQNGSIELTDVSHGTYIYRPNNAYVGTDSFSYVARDRYGNYSTSAQVNLTVARCGSSVTYADLAGSQAETAALTLTERSIMSGTQVGDRYYFYPEQTVNRVDFLVMAMNAAGITDVPDCEQTVFADDSDIPSTMKGYVAAAYRLGYITGSLDNGQLRFLPNEPLTRAQAAVILDRLTEPGKPTVVPTFTDGRDIPVWAADAIYSLNAVGILTSGDGRILPTQSVTRAETAQMLAALIRYREL